MSNTSKSPVDPMPGIPADVACPFCGGYVRGHQWIGTENCSITITEEIPVVLPLVPFGSSAIWRY